MAAFSSEDLFQLGPGAAVIEVPVLHHCGAADGHYAFVRSRKMNAPGLDKGSVE